MRSLCQKASATWGGIILAEGLHDQGMWAVPLFRVHPGICLTTKEKHGKPQSGEPASVTLVAPTWPPL
jgi:hypothetical protein